VTIVYLDTSALVRVLLGEPDAPAILVTSGPSISASRAA